jgi:hypothetical protein
MTNKYWLTDLIWTYVYMRKQMGIGCWLLKRKIKRMAWKLRGMPSLEAELREAKRARAKREGSFNP